MPTTGTVTVSSTGETTDLPTEPDHGAEAGSELTGTEMESLMRKTDGDNSTEDGLPDLGKLDSEEKAGGQRLFPLEKFHLELDTETPNGEPSKVLGTPGAGEVHGLETGTETESLTGRTTGPGETDGEVTGTAMESSTGKTTGAGAETGTEMELLTGETTSAGEVTGSELTGTEMESSTGKTDGDVKELWHNQ